MEVKWTYPTKKSCVKFGKVTLANNVLTQPSIKQMHLKLKST